MELRQLRHFLAVIDHRNFARAAQAVGLTQQAVSHSIAALEDRLQAQLLERGKFGVEPTEVGRMLERRARRICAESDSATAEVMALKDGSLGHIRVGIGQNFATQIVPRAITLFMRARPQISLSVTVATSKQLFDSLSAGLLDLTICTPIISYDAYSELQHEELSEVYLHELHHVVMRPGHPLAGEGELDILALADYPWLIPESLTAPWQRLFTEIADGGGSLPQHVVRTDSDTLGKALLMQSDFVSMIGIEGCVFELRTGQLSARPLNVRFEPARPIMSWRKGVETSRSANVFIDCVKRALPIYSDVDEAILCETRLADE